jgi:MFS family permease
VLQNTSVENKGLHYGWLVVFGGFLTQIILLISIQTLPLVLAQIEGTLKITHAQAGSITSFFGLCYAGFSFFWGYLADKIGTRKTLTIAGILTSIMLILFGSTVDRTLMPFSSFSQGNEKYSFSRLKQQYCPLSLN